MIHAFPLTTQLNNFPAFQAVFCLFALRKSTISRYENTAFQSVNPSQCLCLKLSFSRMLPVVLFVQITTIQYFMIKAFLSIKTTSSSKNIS